MKKLILGSLIAFFSVAAHAQQIDCADSDFQMNGWVIHDSSEFDTLYKDVSKKVEEGIKNSTLTGDIEGQFMTSNSSIAPDLFVRVNTWDSSTTSQDVMYGDIAILVDHFNPERILEVRWFDGNKKHLVFNKTHMYCIATKQPPVSNTIF